MIFFILILFFQVEYICAILKYAQQPCVEESSVTQSCLTLCSPMDYSLPDASVHGISQARILEWVNISFSGDLLDPGIEPRSPALQADSLLSEPLGKPLSVKVLVAQSCLTLCDPMDGSLPGSSVHRIIQARILEWVAMPFSKGWKKGS